MRATGNPGAGEWRRYWSLPLAAAIGHSTGVLHVYSLGSFMDPLQQEFGWSRAQISLGITIVGLVGAALSVPIGALVDRLGPRRVGLAGALLMTGTFALLATATGSTKNWLALWLMVAIGNLGLQATVLVTAVSRRFEASRGLAFAVTLSGASLGAMLFPLLATSLIAAFGWRIAFVALGAGWALIAIPMMFLFFRAPAAPTLQGPAASHTPGGLSGLSVAEGLRSPSFYRLTVVSALFTLTLLGVIVHFVPILLGGGASLATAAKIASLVGIASLIGRIGTGVLLDRFSGRIVGGTILLLPILGSLLLTTGGSNTIWQSAAAVCFGLTVGAEVDVVAYLATRYLGMRNYGVLFGCINACLALGVAVGPVLAGAVFDWQGSYNPFLWATMGLMALCSLALFSLPRTPPFLSQVANS